MAWQSYEIGNTPLRSLGFWPTEALDKIDNLVFLIHTAEQAISVFDGPSGPALLAVMTDLPKTALIVLVETTKQFLEGSLSRAQALENVRLCLSRDQKSEHLYSFEREGT